MKNEQTSKEYLESLKKAIEEMGIFDKACATVLVQLGRIIAELMNRNDWGTIEEMSAVCADLFIQANKMKDKMSKTVH